VPPSPAICPSLQIEETRGLLLGLGPATQSAPTQQLVIKLFVISSSGLQSLGGLIWVLHT
jgi:hypothetical protein